MKYSFLLVNYNMWGLMERCIAGIRRSLEASGDSFEVIVADNSTDPAFRAPDPLPSDARGVSVVHLRENRGWVHALNRILPRATGEYVVVMHPDVELEPDCVQKLGQFLEAHPRAGIVGPDLSYPGGREVLLRTRLPSIDVEARRVLNMAAHTVLKRHVLSGEPAWDRCGDARVDTVSGVMMVVRRAVLEQVGLLDERLWTYHINDWLCVQARRLGWTCHYVAGAKAVHCERYSDPKLYSGRDAAEYKRTAAPVSRQMCRDQMAFLRQCYRRWQVATFQVLITMEYALYMLGQLKPGRVKRRRTLAQLWGGVVAVWA